MNEIMEEVIRFDVRSTHRFIVLGLRSTRLQPLRAFFENFGTLSECKTTSTQGVVYGFVAFHSQRVTQRVRQAVKYAEIDGLRSRVTCVSRELRDRGRGLSTEKMIDVANFFFGNTGWTSELLACELIADSVRTVEVVGDDHVDGVEAYDREVQRLAAAKPAGVTVKSAASRSAVQALFRAHVRVSWCGEHVVTASDKRSYIDGYGEKLVVCSTLELARNLGEKSAVSEALKNAFLGIVLIVVYNNAEDDRAFDVGVHFQDEAFESWSGGEQKNDERQQ